MDYDEENLRELDERLEEAEIAKMAVEKAIDGHRVLKYVKTWPVEPFPLYPALGNPSFAEDFITWSMPGRDHVRATAKGCRINFTRNSEFISCPSERKHYARAKKYNCWNLACPYCLNNTVLKKGDTAEKKLLAFYNLMLRQGANYEVKHWTISPEQEEAVHLVQRVETFTSLKERVIRELMNTGMVAGALVFHPWRQGSTYWELGPHFHAVSYGFVDTSEFRRRNPGWVIKLIHSNEAMRSIRHTIAYLQSHTGIGLSEKTNEEADLDGRFYNMFFPIDGNGDDIDVSIDNMPDRMDFLRGLCSPGPLYNIFDFEFWLQWVKDAYTHTFLTISYFGEVSRKRLRIVTEYKEPISRLCPICESEMCTFEGMADDHPEIAKVNVELPVMAFTENVPMVRDALKQRWYQNILEGGRFRELAESIPEAFIPEIDSKLVINKEQKFTVDLKDPYGGFRVVLVTKEQADRLQFEGLIE